MIRHVPDGLRTLTLRIPLAKAPPALVTWSPSEDETRHPTVILVTVTAGEPFDRVPMRPVRMGFAGADLVAELRELSTVELAQAGDDCDRPLLQTRDAAETQWTSVVEGPAVRTHTEAQVPAPAIDWREAARGIPVWEGALALFDRRTGWWPGRCLDVADAAFLDLPSGHRGSRTPCEAITRWMDGGGEIIPDLSDPDTQPGYLRRLAIELGCPEEVAAEGASFLYTPDPYRAPDSYGLGTWAIVAGLRPTVFDDNGPRPAFESEWERSLKLGTDDRLLALARAWPVDQRVRG
jgi:hypothetical protein